MRSRELVSRLRSHFANVAADPDDDRFAVAAAAAAAVDDGGGGAGVRVRELGASPRRREHPLAADDDASRGVQAAGERRLLQMDMGSS